MVTPEGKVKTHLKLRVQQLGGELRFAKWLGRNGCPDCRVMLPGGWRSFGPFHTAYNAWVETKAGKDGELSLRQTREINRMRELGETVLVLTTIEEIDREFPAPSPGN